MMNLSQYEKEMINAYVNLYGGLHRNQPVDTLDYRLRYWYQNKAFLYEKLGNQFIYSFPVNVEESTAQISDRIADAFYEDYDSALYQFRQAFYEKIDADFGEAYYHFSSIACAIDMLMSPEVLAENKYTGSTTKVTFSSGNTIQIPNGAKPAKIIGKIAKELKLDDEFEAFRNELSTFFNKKKISGDMCISIHPLDFMTLSDNEHSWTSCMSWRNKGCYRRGTVEMMNSEMVVVAYLDDHTSNIQFDEFTWNSKRWRSLFIVTDDAIVSVKGYPYQHDGLVKLVLDKLNELMGGQYNTPIHGESLRYKKDYRLYFDTDMMYNDFSTTTHYALLSDNFVANPRELCINYSGNDICMECGEEDYEFCDEDNPSDTLVCLHCSGLVQCAGCGRWVDIDHAHETEEGIICKNCMEYDYTDDFCKEPRHIGDWSSIYVMNDEIKGFMETKGVYGYLPKFAILYYNLKHYDELDIPFLKDRTIHKDKNGVMYYHISQLKEEAKNIVEIPYWANREDLFKEDYFSAVYEKYYSRMYSNRF